MNKYQKQAIVDMLKVAVAITLGLLAVRGLVLIGVTSEDIIAAGSFALMIYCLYQLFLIRVGQLESQEKTQEMLDKYSK